MNSPIVHLPDPALDLVLERIVDATPAQLWAGLTLPELVTQWFTPAPWRTVECEIDLRPGGIFRTEMRGPEGQQVSYSGCFLEIVPNEKLVWTGALGPGYRPRSTPPGSFLMTAVITLARADAGTRYSALVMHGDAQARAAHEQMGFHVGWGMALDQLVALVSKQP